MMGSRSLLRKTTRPARAKSDRGQSVLRALSSLERLKNVFGAEARAAKSALLANLATARFARPGDLARLHEALCFVRAYPDDAAILRDVERLLANFDRRPDLRRHRAALADSGIAGTETRFRFYAHTASWLARRWGDRLRVDWSRFDEKNSLEPLLNLFALYAESPALDEYDLGVRAWVERMKGPRETDAAFLLRRFERLSGDGFLREAIYDRIDMPMRLLPGPTTPARTREKLSRAPIAFQTQPLRRRIASLPPEIARPPLAVRAVRGPDAARLIDLARATMVARSRDLDAFTHASPDDVRLVECEEGIRIACFGMLPERRLLLESVYGYLVLKNGVPVAYGTSCALYGSSEFAYNVFDAFRGGEAAFLLGRVLSMVRHLFAVDTFTMYPYQLGDENREALRSGAWWFYQKLGFLPRDRAVLRTMREEIRKRRAHPEHLSSIATLRSLAKANVYLHLGRARDDVLGILPLAAVGLAVTEAAAARFGANREVAARACTLEASRLVGLRSLSRFSRGERLAWVRWAPVVVLLPGIARWSREEKRALVEVVRAKGGARESDFVLGFDRHRRLRAGLRALAESAAARAPR